MKSVTLSADEYLIDAARRAAADEHTTLSAKFREWLRDYTQSRHRGKAAAAAAQRRECVALPTDSAEQLREKYPTPDGQLTRGELAVATARILREKYPSGGRKFTREEMNER